MKNETLAFTDAAIPTGSGNLAFESVGFSLLGTGKEKQRLTAFIESKGGVVCSPGKKTQYLVYDPAKAESLAFWPKAKAAEAKGEMYLLTIDLFDVWTQEKFFFNTMGYDQQLCLIRHYLTHMPDWEPDLYGRIEGLLLSKADKIIDKLAATDAGRLLQFYDILAAGEKVWTKTGYSDGYYVYRLVEKAVDKAIEDKNLNMTAALLDYKAARYDQAFVEAEKSDALDIELGQKEKPAIYYYKGGTVSLGTWVQSAAQGAEPEPIEWEALAQEDGKTLLISKHALVGKPYHTGYANVMWETCSLRAWLNGEFYHTAFSAEEQAKIVTTEVAADRNPDYKADPGCNTQDKVFLLSIREAEQYFTADDARQCRPTADAAANGAWTDVDSENGWWWLRTPGIRNNYAACVYADGSICVRGYFMDAKDLAVRPALWVRP